jgi:hypothetical protein
MFDGVFRGLLQGGNIIIVGNKYREIHVAVKYRSTQLTSVFYDVDVDWISCNFDGAYIIYKTKSEYFNNKLLSSELSFGDCEFNHPKQYTIINPLHIIRVIV